MKYLYFPFIVITSFFLLSLVSNTAIATTCDISAIYAEYAARGLSGSGLEAEAIQSCLQEQRRQDQAEREQQEYYQNLYEIQIVYFYELDAIENYIDEYYYGNFNYFQYYMDDADCNLGMRIPSDDPTVLDPDVFLSLMENKEKCVDHLLLYMEAEIDQLENLSTQPPTCATWTYSEWGACQSNGTQSRTITSSSPAGCSGGSPVLSQSCSYIPACTESSWTFDYSPSICPSSGQQKKIWSKTGQCQGGVTHPSEETVSCKYQAPSCTDYVYSEWGACQSNGMRTRTITSSLPSGCHVDNPILTQTCTQQSSVCTSWIYSDWSACINGQQTRAIISKSSSGCTVENSVLARSCQGSSTETVVPSESIASAPSSVNSQSSVSISAERWNEVMNEEREETDVIDMGLAERMAGRILLQVEQHGQAWYQDTVTLKRYYLENGASAYEVLRRFGLGITNADLAKIPVGHESRFEMNDADGDGLPDKLEEALGTSVTEADTDGDGVNDGIEALEDQTNPLGTGRVTYSLAFSNRLNGRILLQVESRGEAWYLNPADGRRYYMANGEAAYQIMRYLSLGITNDDIRRIPLTD